MPEKKEKVEKQGRLTDAEIQDYIDGIFNGNITIESLSEQVYFSIANYLKKGLYKGYGYTIENAPGSDLELLQELRENVYMFGAAKNYQMTKEISSLLTDEDGNLRTSKEFNDVARQTYDNWNDNWGETEYSTAVGQGMAAIQWNQIEKQKDILPHLRYSAIGDACDICEPLDGLVATVDDPIWTECAPLNHFNCRCVLLQEDEEVELTDKDEKNSIHEDVQSRMDATFQSNPGKDGMVFNESHPYFEVAKADREYAKNNFDMPIPKKD